MENIFISHIHEEAPLAKALKEELEATTVGQWRVFVSSDSANITLGDQWFSKIDAALGGHRLLLALCSPASMQRLWIGYEVGYAAAKGVPIIPICHSGLKVDALPSFLSRYQGISIDAPGFAPQLFEAIQKHIPLPRPPRFLEQEIAKVMQEALAEILAQPQRPSQDSTASEIDTPLDIKSRRILLMLAHSEYGCVFVRRITETMEFSSEQWQSYLDILEGRGLVVIKIVSGTLAMCYITPIGKKYLVTNELIDK